MIVDHRVDLECKVFPAILVHPVHKDLLDCEA